MKNKCLLRKRKKALIKDYKKALTHFLQGGDFIREAERPHTPISMQHVSKSESRMDLRKGGDTYPLKEMGEGRKIEKCKSVLIDFYPTFLNITPGSNHV